MRKDVQLLGYILFFSWCFLIWNDAPCVCDLCATSNWMGNPPGKLATILDQINGLAPFFLESHL